MSNPDAGKTFGIVRAPGIAGDAGGKGLSDAAKRDLGLLITTGLGILILPGCNGAAPTETPVVNDPLGFGAELVPNSRATYDGFILAPQSTRINASHGNVHYEFTVTTARSPQGEVLPIRFAEYTDTSGKTQITPVWPVAIKGATLDGIPNMEGIQFFGMKQEAIGEQDAAGNITVSLDKSLLTHPLYSIFFQQNKTNAAFQQAYQDLLAAGKGNDNAAISQLLHDYVYCISVADPNAADEQTANQTAIVVYYEGADQNATDQLIGLLTGAKPAFAASEDPSVVVNAGTPTPPNNTPVPSPAAPLPSAVPPTPTPEATAAPTFEQWAQTTQEQALANAQQQKTEVETMFGVTGLGVNVEQRIDPVTGNLVNVVVTVDNRTPEEKAASWDLSGIPLQITAGAEGEWRWIDGTNLRNVANASNTNMLAYVDISDATWDGDHVDGSAPFHLQRGNTYAQTEQLILQNFNSIFPGVYTPERLLEFPTRPPGHFSYFAAENGLNNTITAFFRGDFTHKHQDAMPTTDAEVDAFVANRIDYVLDQVELQKAKPAGGAINIIFANEAVSDYGGYEDTFLSRRYNRDGNNWVSEMYVQIVQAAQARGLEMGKDYNMIIGEYGIEVNQQKADLFVEMMKTAKQQIAQRLGITPDQVQMEVWDQFHTHGGNGDKSGMGFYDLANMDDAGVQDIITRLQTIKNEVGPIQIGELDISGARNDTERANLLRNVVRIAKALDITSIGLYAPFSTEEENIGIFEVDGSTHEMVPTQLFYIFLKELLTLLDTKQ